MEGKKVKAKYMQIGFWLHSGKVARHRDFLLDAAIPSTSSGAATEEPLLRGAGGH